MKTDNTFFLIGRIKEHYTAFLEQSLKTQGIEGIVTSHGDIIMTLYRNGTLTMSEIAVKINRDRSTVTTLIGKLEKFGYVITQKNETDNRSNVVSLTEKGLSLLPDFELISRNLFELSRKDISDEEWETFRAVLIKLHQNLI